jgi:hypothetical protein
MNVDLNDVQTEILRSDNPAFAIYTFFHINDARAFKLLLNRVIKSDEDRQPLDNGILIRILSEKARGKLKEDALTTQIGFTLPGLKALQIDGRTLATFPEPFQQGMAARAKLLDDTGNSAPENWHGYLGSTHVHGLLWWTLPTEARAALAS